MAGAPKTDKLSICNATFCQSFSMSHKNPAGMLKICTVLINRCDLIFSNYILGFEMFGAAISGGDKVGDPTFVSVVVGISPDLNIFILVLRGKRMIQI